MQEFIKANSINEITEGLPKDTVVGSLREGTAWCNY